MAKVRETMTKGLPQVDVPATLLRASKVANQKRASGVVVFQDGSPVGMLTERCLTPAD